MRNFLNSLDYYDLPVGTSDIGAKIDSNVIISSDIIGANIHPFFGGPHSSGAMKWSLDYYYQQLKTMDPSLNFFISEIGWPSDGGSIQSSVASVEAQQDFLNHFICTINKEKIEWYWFEAFDEPWKKVYDTDNSKWESKWGIFDENRVLKLKLPVCQ